jgi:L-threonylcarbamoyladenylate synthase
LRRGYTGPKNCALIMPDSIKRAVDVLKAGGLVAMPTETVYGLAADANNVSAINKIFSGKGRPSGHPLIVHIAQPDGNLSNDQQVSSNTWLEILSQWSRDVSPEALILAHAFWPGPLTMILPKAKNVLLEVTGGQETVGVRCPKHPVAQNLLKEFGGGLAAPSANRFGRISPTTAEHVREEFPGNEVLVLDGGPCDVGIESTIVDLTRLDTHGAVILRPGAITQAMIDELLGNNGMPDKATVKTVSATQTLSEAAPRVSGSLSAHYAPKTKLVLYDLKDAESLFSKANNSDIKRIAWIHFPKDVSDQGSDLKNVAKEVLLPLESKALARELYALLRHLDGLSLDCIFFEQLPDGVEWEAIRDRLGRASVGSGV